MAARCALPGTGLRMRRWLLGTRAWVAPLASWDSAGLSEGRPSVAGPGQAPGLSLSACVPVLGVPSVKGAGSRGRGDTSWAPACFPPGKPCVSSRRGSISCAWRGGWG